MNHAGVPVYRGDFYSDGTILNPFPVYRELRELGPVVWMAEHNCYALPRYAETTYALRNDQVFISSKGVSLLEEANKRLVGSTLNSDNPQHDITRAVTAEPMFPGNLTVIEPTIRSAAERLVGALCERGHFDAISDFATYLPVTIVSELVGLPNTSADQMLKWASATFNLFGANNQRAKDSLSVLKDLKAFLDENGTPDKLIAGGWAHRIFEVGEQKGFAPETCAQLMRDYINPSLDTTISATGQCIKFLCDNPEQWQLLRSDPGLIPNAIEESVRLATPIRAFTRYVAEETKVAGFTLPQGSRVIVMYASANRDERHFPEPERFDIRRDVHDHVGFGHGIHMCMGMHLARLEMRCLLEALCARVETIEQVGEPTVAMNNSIRAYSSLPVRVTPAARTTTQPQTTKTGSGWLNAVVSSRKQLTPDIVELAFRPHNAVDFSTAEPGAHIDIKLPSGLVRQYSLHTVADNATYSVAVLNDPDSRGGSREVHTALQAETEVQISAPRNHFPLSSGTGCRYLLAGGIGITPLKAMAETLVARQSDYQLIYFGRNAEQMAYVDELAQLHTDRLTVVTDRKAFDLQAVLANAKPDDQLYTCGPNGFMDFVFESARQEGWSAAQLHKEHFGAEISTEGDVFTVETQRSGVSFNVAPGETIAAKLLEQGIDVPMSCQSGVCGTCLTRVIKGTPDHRDLVLNDLEKASNQQIAVCCSRSKSKTLVLDL
ncbi:MAG: cytochrome P450/oxidoreductase [Thiolinea sp.]